MLFTKKQHDRSGQLPRMAEPRFRAAMQTVSIFSLSDFLRNSRVCEDTLNSELRANRQRRLARKRQRASCE